MILWAVFAGIVAHAVPTGWQWPERMAARTLDMPMWAADALANIAASRIVTANRKALEACMKQAKK